MPKIEMGKMYRTRNGRPVRILCVDYNPQYTNQTMVLGLATETSGKENCYAWKLDGKSDINEAYDLIEVRPRIKLSYWVNINKGTDQPWAGGLYFSKDNANSMALEKRIACVKIEIDCEEGEGLDT